MKFLLTALFLPLLTQAASAEPPTKADLFGHWWGSEIATEPESGVSKLTNIHWIIERTADGLFKEQRMRVDHANKVYAPFNDKPDEGSWEIRGDLVIYKYERGSVTPHRMNVRDGAIRWSPMVGTGPSLKREYKEIKIEGFAPKLGEDYKLITSEEFSKLSLKALEKTQRSQE